MAYLCWPAAKSLCFLEDVAKDPRYKKSEPTVVRARSSLRLENSCEGLRG